MISPKLIRLMISTAGCLALSSFTWVPPNRPVWNAQMTHTMIEPSEVIPASVPLFDALIRDAARDYQLDPALLNAIISVESGFDSRSVSATGACGLTQLMPGTARLFNVQDIFDPKENIEAGAHHFRNLLVRFSNNLPLSLAAYNAGEAPVLRYHGIPPYPETQGYVQHVLLEFRRRSNESIPGGDL